MRTRHLLSQTAIYMIGLGASRGISIALVPLYTRQLTEAEFFTWDVCTTSVLFILAVAELGMSSALARFYVKADTDAERRGFAQTSTGIAMITAIGTVALLLAMRSWASNIVFGDASRGNLIALLSLTVVLTVFSNLPLALLRAQNRPVAFAVVCILRALVAPVCIITMVVYWKMGVPGILLGDAAGLAVVAIAGIVLNRADLLPRVHRAAMRDLLAFGIPLIPIGIANAIVLVSDRYFLVHAVAPSVAATYSLGARIATLVNLVTMALQTAWAPTAFRIAKLGDAQQRLADTFRILVTALGLLGLATAATAPELQRLFAPHGAYEGASRIVVWVAFSFVMQTVVYIMTTNLVIANKTIYPAAVFCSGAVLKLALNYAVIARYGIQGVAAATLLTYIYELLLSYAFGCKIYPLPYDLKRLLGFAALITLAAAGVTWAADFPVVLSLAIRAGIVIVFLALLLALGIVPRHEVRSAMEAVGSKLKRS